MQLYNCILNIFDINIQIRLTNGGGGSGCVTDSCFLNKFIITTQDLYDNALSKNYNNVIICNTIENNDWIPILNNDDMGGYSENDIEKIATQILLKKNEIINHNNGINEELNKRLSDYPKKLINFLKLNKYSKICFITPYGDDKSGISDFSFATISEISNYLQHIDIYTDCNFIDIKIISYKNE
jgi:hypothetical protein